MDAQRNENPVALAIAQAMVEGFNKHYRIFRETSRRAKESFEAAGFVWTGDSKPVPSDKLDIPPWLRQQ